MGEELECPSHPTLTPKKKCRHHQQQIYAKDFLLQYPAEGCGRCWAEKHVEKKVLPCQRAWELPLRLESPAGVSVFSGGRVGDTGTVSPADSSALSDVALEGA